MYLLLMLINTIDITIMRVCEHEYAKAHSGFTRRIALRTQLLRVLHRESEVSGTKTHLEKI